MMEARRIECRKGHVLAVLKTEEGADGDDFAREMMNVYDDICLYCEDPIFAVQAPLSDFDRWSSREDRYHTMGAPYV